MRIERLKNTKILCYHCGHRYATFRAFLQDGVVDIQMCICLKCATLPDIVLTEKVLRKETQIC